MKDTSFMLLSFLESADSLIHENTKNNVISAWESVLYKEDPNGSAVNDLIVPLQGLSDLVSVIEERIPDAEKCYAFINAYMGKQAVRDMCKYHIGFRLCRMDEIQSISPGYLDQFVKDVTAICSKIYAGAIPKDAIGEITDPKYASDIKRNLVHTTLPNYMTSSDICEVKYYDTCVLTESNSKTNAQILNFLVRYKNQKLMNNESMREIAKKVISKIKSTDAEIKLMLRTLENSDVPKIGVAEVSYIIQTIYLDITKYLVAMTMRFGNAYAYNIKHINMNIKAEVDYNPELDQFYNTKSNSFVEDGDEAHGCTLEGVVGHAKRIYGRYEQISEDDICPEDEFSDEIYITPITICDDIVNAVSKFMDFCSESEWTPIRETSILKDIEDIKTTISMLFSKIRDVDSLKYANSLLGYAKRDLGYCVEKLFVIQHKMNATYKFILETEDKVREKYSENPDRMKDILDIIESMKNTFFALERNIMSVYDERLYELDALIPRREEPIAMDETDTFADEANAILGIMESAFEIELRNINKKYSEMYLNRHSAYYEANEDQKVSVSDPTKEQNTNQNNSQGGNQQVQQNQNTGNNNQNAENQNKVENKQNANTSTGDKESIGQKVQKFIDGIIESMTDFFNGEGCAKNKRLINNQRDYLSNRDYTGATMEVIPYVNIDYGEILNDIVDKAANVDPDLITAGDSEKITAYILSGVDGFQRTDPKSPLRERLVQAFQTGGLPVKVKKFSGNRIKSMMPGMLSFTLDYYEGMIGTFTDVKNKLKSNLQRLENETKELGGKTTESLAHIEAIITTSIGVVRDVTKKKSNDYMHIFDNFKEKAVKNNAGNGNQGGGDVSQTTEQNNQSNDQNGQNGS